MNKWYKDANLDWSTDSVRLSVTPSLTAKEMFYYIQEVGRLQTYSNYFTERENLDSYLIVYTINGKGKLHYGEGQYLLEKGDVFFIDCREYQYYYADPSQNWELYFIHFNGGFIYDYYNKWMQLNGPVIRLGEDKIVPSCIEKIITIHQNKDIRTELLSSKYITDILTVLLSFSMNSTSEPNSFDVPEHIQQIKSFLETNFSEKITLDILSSTFAISKYHLAREFKRYVGMSPYDFQFTIRINKAKELLKYSQMSIEAISYEIGIEQVSHFIRLFKEKDEMTPLQYRKTWQQGKR